MRDPRLTVVVITRDRAAELAGAVDRLLGLPEGPRVVVVDNASVDGTPVMLRRDFPGVELLSLPANIGAAGRNLGLTRAITPYVAFADDDTWWEPGALRRAADVLDRFSRLALVTGRIVVEPVGTEDPVCADLRDAPLPHPDLPGHPLLSFLAGATVTRRAALLGAGGFHWRLLVGGEEELLGADLAAAGWAMAHVPEVAVHHRASAVRDPDRRRRLGIRNTLWFAWARRPAGAAARRTVATARRVPRDATSLGAFGDVVGGVPWVLRERRVVPASVEAGLRRLDRQQLVSPARRYVS